MSPRTSREIEQIDHLCCDFIDAINRAQVSRQTALDALEYAFDDLLSQGCDSEEAFSQCLDAMRDRALRTWRRRNTVARVAAIREILN